ncbi:hypothetical protein N7E70_026465 [Aminobacter sp. NyZ550]|uniref:Uncharacterized protein n=1 Tax=Aminobacter ciceronei TaxID=150723 RepID=A0ABR6CEM5_9HYPH|nr:MULTISPECIES: hypothetical protein [Aminobacter]MBA8909313.1 hypothetical protein [Aminobacter ciceronei]MBA9023083.1 hypothetical protein [Aminobacter ciceronei]MRX36543.1 hypothetical protein [Aminobacter sp. MDW-2]QNH34222.1 hypothetical protein H5P29_27880 [Aminobacter sp. MDW-2]WAX95144.1 hypothetical protein N7E70_026465 [Aminobacter sp. NyZ550]
MLRSPAENEHFSKLCGQDYRSLRDHHNITIDLVRGCCGLPPVLAEG